MEDKTQNGQAVEEPVMESPDVCHQEVTGGTTVEMLQREKTKHLYYGVRENPPLHVALICGIQHSLMSLAGKLVTSLLVAQAVCAGDNEVFKSRLLSSVLVMSGATTIASALFGVRLPLLQGGNAIYIIPLLMIGGESDGGLCTANDQGSGSNVTADFTNDKAMEKMLSNVRSLQGSLMLVGVFHALLGLTGISGWLLKFIGPLTIVPTMIMMIIFYVEPVLRFVEVSWGISLSTTMTAVVLFLYLSKYNMPLPIWTPSGGFRIIRYPLHQIFAILISIIFNWLLCGLLTYLGVFSDDPNGISYKARTDARFHVVYDSAWFTFPYPGQFGTAGFNVKAFISFLIATLLSVLDSIGDYCACARVSRVPVPPTHAINRGILIEGLCTILSGAVGCGVSQTTSGSSIGAIGVTKVASRIQFVFAGLVFVLFGLFGKVSAFFISIPYPVLGGATIVLSGIFFGVIISNLQVTNMSSSRNVAILGLSTFIGLLVPTWASKTVDPINTGIEQFDKVVTMLLINPSLTTIIIACILDNTVSGTKVERGIAAWQMQEDASEDLDPELYDEGFEVYQPLCPQSILSSRLTKYIPFLPDAKCGEQYKNPKKGTQCTEMASEML